MAIPAKLCERIGFAAGETLLWEEQGDSLRLIPCSRLLEEVQNQFAPYRIEGENQADLLIAERRRDAALENLRG